MYVMALKSNNDDYGDVAIVTFNDDGRAISARTVWDITPFIALLNQHFPPPDGCEWRRASLLMAKVVKNG